RVFLNALALVVVGNLRLIENLRDRRLKRRGGSILVVSQGLQFVDHLRRDGGLALAQASERRRREPDSPRVARNDDPFDLAFDLGHAEVATVFDDELESAGGP